MNSEVTELLKRALALPVSERAALANALLDTLEDSSPPVEQAWEEEVARRMQDLRAGKSSTVPWEQLQRDLLAMLHEG